MEKGTETKIELPQKPAEEPGVEAWEDEGGSVEVEQETISEVPEKTWREIITDASEEFPDSFKIILDKVLLGKKVSPEEQSGFDLELDKWWKENFGMKFSQRTLSTQEVKERRQLAEKRGAKLTELEIKKKEEMVRLHNALTSLDTGEPVNEFRDETRRVVYFNEENQQYFVEENGARKNIGIGDIISDYAWGIKYVPDGEMTESAYRTLAKRILVNEARRDLEKLHDSELVIEKPHRISAVYFSSKTWSQIKDLSKDGAKEELEKLLIQNNGFVTEIAVRELLSRISLNLNLNLVVSRATVEEDVDHKYDFKVRVKHRIRGVGVQSQNSNSVGFQLKSKIKKKTGNIGFGRPIKVRDAAREEIDEIITLRVPGKEFFDTTKKWLEAGEPSGGPEQFLSPKLKKAILKAVTEKLTTIPQEVFDKLQ